jgi:uncharacterized protein (DUF488 family)
MTSGPGRLISVGYGGRRLTEFIDLLLEHGVEVVVDVRLTPVTRVPGFSGAALGRSLPGIGIEYIHEPRLGNPVENRVVFRSGALDIGCARFASILEGTGRLALAELVARARRQRVAVLCAERRQHHCHRQVIITAAQRLSPNLAVTVLG